MEGLVFGTPSGWLTPRLPALRPFRALLRFLEGQLGPLQQAPQALKGIQASPGGTLSVGMVQKVPVAMHLLPVASCY